MNIKMIVSDIDGTLLTSSGELSLRTRAALAACVSRGIRVVLASGRTFYNARDVAVMAGLNGPVISANGGRVDMTPSGQVVFEDVIERDMSMRIYRQLLCAGCFMTSYVGDKVYELDETNGYGSTCVSRSEARRARSYIIANDPERMLREGTVNPYKYEAYSDDTLLIERIKRVFSSWGLSVSSAFPCNAEIMSPGGGKGRALKALADMLGVDNSEIMAFGDGTNDIGMLKYARYSVAMGNAVGELKDIAWKVAPVNDADGVAQIIYQTILAEGA